MRYLLGFIGGRICCRTGIDGTSIYLWLLGALKANFGSNWWGFLGVAAISVNGVLGIDVISFSILATPPLISSFSPNVVYKILSNRKIVRVHIKMHKLSIFTYIICGFFNVRGRAGRNRSIADEIWKGFSGFVKFMSWISFIHRKQILRACWVV